MAAETFPLRLRHHLCSYQSTLLLLHFRNPRFQFHPLRSIRVSSKHLLLSWPLLVCRSRRWDSNAKSYNRNSEGEAAYGEFDDNTEHLIDFLRDYIDSIWILKVFLSFGWLLPPIILLLLIVNGLKAFLMALALPIGQSTLAFALQRIRNLGKSKSKKNIIHKREDLAPAHQGKLNLKKLGYGLEPKGQSEERKKITLGFREMMLHNITWTIK